MNEDPWTDDDHPAWPDGWALPDPDEEAGRTLARYLEAASQRRPGLVFVPPPAPPAAE